MKKTIILLLVFAFLFIACGKPPLTKVTNTDQANFLFSIVGMIMALAVTNLVKGFDVLVKYLPGGLRSAIINCSRWQMRLLWGISLAFLIFQLVWGMRLVIDKSIDLQYFSYYIGLAGLVYAMVVYVFPENIDEVFFREKNREHEKYWSKKLISRLYKLYMIYGIYLFLTIPMSYKFWIESQSTNEVVWLRDGNLFGILLKSFTFLVLIKAIWIKYKQERIKESDLNPENNRKENNGKVIILKLDYFLLGMSMLINFYYIIIRTNELWR